MNAFKLFDPYSLRARLFPALLATASLLIAIIVIVPWHRLSIAHAAASIAVPVVLFAMADVARRSGKKREAKLYEKWGGMPTTRMMRHTDNTFDPDTKDAYIRFVAEKLQMAIPTRQEELANPQKTDAFYDRCAAWLRENTRSTKKFGILFNENVTYGFRRNLFAIKSSSLAIDLLLIIAAGGYELLMRPEDELHLKLLLVLIVAIAHAVYIVFASTESSVRDAANTYGRQLLLCCEALSAATPKGRRRSNTK